MPKFYHWLQVNKGYKIHSTSKGTLNICIWIHNSHFLYCFLVKFAYRCQSSFWMTPYDMVQIFQFLVLMANSFNFTVVNFKLEDPLSFFLSSSVYILSFSLFRAQFLGWIESFLKEKEIASLKLGWNGQNRNHGPTDVASKIGRQTKNIKARPFQPVEVVG